MDTVRLSSNYFLRDSKLQSSISLKEFTAAMRNILREEEYDSIAIIEGEGKNKCINEFWKRVGDLTGEKNMNKELLKQIDCLLNVSMVLKLQWELYLSSAEFLIL